MDLAVDPHRFAQVPQLPVSEPSKSWDRDVEVSGRFIELFVSTLPGDELLLTPGPGVPPTSDERSIAEREICGVTVPPLSSRCLLKSASLGSRDLKPKMFTPQKDAKSLGQPPAPAEQPTP